MTSPSAQSRLTELVVPGADLDVAADKLAVDHLAVGEMAVENLGVGEVAVEDLAVEVPEVVAVEPQERKRVVRELPLALVIAGVALGLVIIGLHHFRWGNLLIAGSLLVGAFCRLVLPTRQAGLLAVRSRFTDVVTMSAMGGSLMLLALITST